MSARTHNPTAFVILAAFVLVSCGGGGGAGSSPPPVTPPTPPPPVGTAPTRISILSDYVVVPYAQGITLTWDSDAAACTASAGWTGAKTSSGSIVIPPLIRTTDFDISCATGSFAPVTATVEVTVLGGPAGPAPSNHVTSVSGLTSLDFQKFGIGLRDVVWDPQHSLFYGVTLPASPIAPNSLVSIDPLTLATRAVALGAEPFCLAVSPDGTYLYVGFRTAGSIRRFLTIGLTQNLAFNVGTAGSVVQQIAVSPVSSRTIAVRANGLVATTDSSGVVIVDDAVSRPNTIHGQATLPSVNVPNLQVVDIDWNADGSHILAGFYVPETSAPPDSPKGLLDLAVNAQGVAVTRHLGFPLAATGMLAGDRYYLKNGAVFSLDGPVHYLGLMAGGNHPPLQFLTWLSRGKTFGAGQRLNTGANTGGTTLDSFDTERFTLSDSIVFGDATKVAAGGTPVFWGSDGIAFFGPGEFAVAHGSFMGAGGIPPVAAIPPPAQNSYSATVQSVNARIFDIGATAIAASSCGHVYAATSSSAAPRPNAVLDIDLASGLITRSVHAGSDPYVLAASDDCSQLYVGRRFSDSVAKVQLSDLTVTGELPLNGNLVSPGLLSRARSMSVAPGLPGTVAIAKSDLEYTECAQLDQDLEIFDGMVRRPTPWSSGFSSGVKSVVWGPNANTLYGLQGGATFAFNVNSGGANNPALLVNGALPPVPTYDLGNALHFDRGGNRLYTRFGTGFDIASSTQLAQFAIGVTWEPCGSPGSAVTTDATSGKVFWVSEPITDPVVRIFTGSPLAQTAQFTMTSLQGFPVALARPSSDSLAVLMSEGAVVVVQGLVLQP